MLRYSATLALREFLPVTGPSNAVQKEKHFRIGIFLFVVAGVIFRSEIALLLFTHLFYLVVDYKISVKTTIKTGIQSALVALAVSVPVDSFFWQRPVWPELAGFYYNAIQGKSADWGTSPYTTYFNSLLPKLLLNPIIVALIPSAFVFPAIRFNVTYLTLPCVLFISIYSLQPHKEARFIIYVVPSLTAAASLSASYIWTRRSKSALYTLGSLIIVLSVLGSFIASTIMLLVSSLNYPGGEALTQLHSLQGYTSFEHDLIVVHMDVLSCMTGVTQFGQRQRARDWSWMYDKTENDELLRPMFWTSFDYLLMAEPEKAIGAWEVVDTVYAYAGIEVLRPGQESGSEKVGERLYEANNGTKGEGALSSEEVKEAIEGSTGSVVRRQEGGSLADIKKRLVQGELTRAEMYFLARDAVRLVTGGWWIGPRMKPAIYIMKAAKVHPLP